MKWIKVSNELAERKEFKKLQIIEFSSGRKREAIIVKIHEDKIVLYCKGVGSIIEN